MMRRLEVRCEALTGELPPVDATPRMVKQAGEGRLLEVITNPEYRWRSVLILVCWLLAYPGIVYGPGAFLYGYMVDHGENAEFVFRLSIAASVVTFVAFLINARFGERVERKNVLFVMAPFLRSALC